MKRSLFAILPMTLLLSITSCVNEEFDLSKVEVNEIAGLEGLSFPLGSSKSIMLDELVDLGADDAILKTDGDGNYYVGISNTDIFTRSYTIPYFSFDGYTEKNPHDFTTPISVTVPELNQDFVSPVIPFTDIYYDIEIDQRNLPDAIGDLCYAEVSSEIGVDFNYDQSKIPLKGIILAEGTSITFPEWVVLGELADGFNKISDHKVELSKEYRITPEGISVSFPLVALDFSKLPENQGVIGPGHLYLDAEIHLSGGIIIKSSDCTSSGIYRPVVSTFIHLSPIEVKNLRLSKVDFGEEASDVHRISLSGLVPDLILDEGFTCDMNDITLKINHYNGLPFSGMVSTSVATYKDDQTSPLRQYDFDLDVDYQLGINDDMVYHCFTENGKDGSIRVDGLNGLLDPVPDYLDITTDIRLKETEEGILENEDYGVIVPGTTYSFTGGYELIAPLSFGKEFSLAFSYDIKDLDLRITDLVLSEVQVQLNLINTLPFEFDIEAQPLDKEGNVLSHISVELEGDIKGGTISEPATNPVVIRLTNSGELYLDGLHISMSAAGASEENVLNSNQYIQLTDIRLILPKGISYDFGENN